MSKRQGVAWNKDRTGSVVLGKLKEFTIGNERANPDTGPFYVKGWFNSESHFMFGWFDTKEEAEVFLQNIHDMY